MDEWEVALLKHLRHGRGRIVFVDDTGVPGGIPNSSKTDFVAYAGVSMSLVAHRALEVKHAALLERFPGIREMQANALRRKKKGWEPFSDERCLDALEGWMDLFLQFAEAVPFLFMNSQDFAPFVAGISPQQLQTALQITGWRLDDHRHVTQGTFLASLPGWLAKRLGPEELVLVRDVEGAEQRGPLPIRRTEARIFCDAVFRLHSHELAGLQMADLAAYSLSRAHTLAKQVMGGEDWTEFDKAIAFFLLRRAKHLYAGIDGTQLDGEGGGG